MLHQRVHAAHQEGPGFHLGADGPGRQAHVACSAAGRSIAAHAGGGGLVAAGAAGPGAASRTPVTETDAEQVVLVVGAGTERRAGLEVAAGFAEAHGSVSLEAGEGARAVVQHVGGTAAAGGPVQVVGAGAVDEGTERRNAAVVVADLVQVVLAPARVEHAEGLAAQSDGGLAAPRPRRRTARADVDAEALFDGEGGVQAVTEVFGAAKAEPG